MNFKISVIIPLYNSEDTISAAVDSVLNQEWPGNFLEDIELILVDDCSTDKSKSIIDSYAEKYGNVFALSTDENKGNPGTARNVGIEYSTGEYLMFLDSDDEFCPDICRTLYGTILKEDSDIVSCNYYQFDNDRVYNRVYKNNGSNLIFKDNITIYNEFDSTFFGNILVWNKIYKKSLIVENNIKFPNIAEDFIFNTYAFIHANKIIQLNEYFGIKHFLYEDSLSNSQTLKDINNHFNVLYEVYYIIKDSGYDVSNYHDLKFEDIKTSIIIILKNASYLNDNEELRFVLKKLYEYEKFFNYTESLDNHVLDFVNFFIIRKHLFIVFLILKIFHIFLNVNFIRSVYRLVLKNVQK